MTHLKNSFFCAILALAFIPASGFAQARIIDLQVDVRLLDNGDAIISETRETYVEDNVTELYFPINNLGASKILNLAVKDDDGLEYRFVDQWNVNLSREAKAGKCGIVYTQDGVEICWGCGEPGFRTFTTSYLVTGLVKAYHEADGFNWMFVNRNLTTKPESVTVVVHADEHKWLSEDKVKMWAFGYEGEVQYESGAVVARSNGELEKEQAVILLVQLEKGVLNPTCSVDMDFEELKQRAFDGSDYGEVGFFQAIKEDPALLIPLSFLLLPVVFIIINLFKIRKLRKNAHLGKEWFRDIPYNGDLRKANAVVNACNYVHNNYKGLISAAVMRLINIGALKVEDQYVQASGFSRALGNQGSVKKCIVIGDIQQHTQFPVTRLLTILYDVFKNAAGEDQILQPKELKGYLTRNPEKLDSLMVEVKLKMSVNECNKDIENVRKVLGLKQFLKDFTLANERQMSEVTLWGEYLVYAELFGIADQVRKDMKQLNPEIFQIDAIYQALNNQEVVSDLITYTWLATSMRSTGSSLQSIRSGGFGGFSSLGGGGGFSGGGSGGGFR